MNLKELEILVEGRKHALAILRNPEVVAELIPLDPTQQGKYLELFAKILKGEWGTSNYPEGIDFIKKEISPLIKEAEKRGFSEDISKIKTSYDLMAQLRAFNKKITRSKMKSGISGLTEKEDYATLYFRDGIAIYTPFSWEAARTIAGTGVAGVEGKWCIAYQKDKGYWNDHHTEGKIFLMVIDYNKDIDPDHTKYCVEYNTRSEDWKVWNQEDVYREVNVIPEGCPLSRDILEECFPIIDNFSRAHRYSYDKSQHDPYVILSSSLDVFSRTNRLEFQYDVWTYDSYDENGDTIEDDNISGYIYIIGQDLELPEELQRSEPSFSEVFNTKDGYGLFIQFDNSRDFSSLNHLNYDSFEGMYDTAISQVFLNKFISMYSKMTLPVISYVVFLETWEIDSTTKKIINYITDNRFLDRTEQYYGSQRFIELNLPEKEAGDLHDELYDVWYDPLYSPEPDKELWRGIPGSPDYLEPPSAYRDPRQLNLDYGM